MDIRPKYFLAALLIFVNSVAGNIVLAESGAVRGLKDQQKKLDRRLSDNEDRIRKTETRISEIQKTSKWDSEFQVGNCDVCQPGHSACSADLSHDGSSALPPSASASAQSTQSGPRSTTNYFQLPSQLPQAEPSCLKLFKSNPKLDLLTPACAFTVRNSCRDISKQLEILDLEGEVLTLRTENEDIRAKSDKLVKKVEDAREVCTDCNRNDSPRDVGPRQPGPLDYLVAGLQAVTPAVTGYFQEAMFADSLNSYYKGYGKYVDQRTQIGVPAEMPGGPFGIGQSVYGGAFGGGYGNSYGGMFGGGSGMYPGMGGGAYGGGYLGAGPGGMGGSSGIMIGDDPRYWRSPFGGSPFGGSPFGGSPFGGSPFGGGYSMGGFGQESSQSALLNYQRSIQSQQDLMIANQQMMEAQSRVNPNLWGAGSYLYSAGAGGFELGGGVGFGGAGSFGASGAGGFGNGGFGATGVGRPF